MTHLKQIKNLKTCTNTNTQNASRYKHKTNSTLARGRSDIAKSSIRT